MVLGLLCTVTITTPHVERRILERGVPLEPPNPRDGPCHGLWIMAGITSPPFVTCSCSVSLPCSSQGSRSTRSDSEQRPGSSGQARPGMSACCGCVLRAAVARSRTATKDREAGDWRLAMDNAAGFVSAANDKSAGFDQSASFLFHMA